MTRRANRNVADENTFVGVTTAVKRNSGSVSSFLAQGDFLGVPLRYPNTWRVGSTQPITGGMF